jgi:hypothetical protein
MLGTYASDSRGVARSVGLWAVQQSLIPKDRFRRDALLRIAHAMVILPRVVSNVERLRRTS